MIKDTILEEGKKLNRADRMAPSDTESNSLRCDSSEGFYWPLPNGKRVYYRII